MLWEIGRKECVTDDKPVVNTAFDSYKLISWKLTNELVSNGGEIRVDSDHVVCM